MEFMAFHMLAHEFQSYILGTSVWSYKLLLPMMVSRRNWSQATLSLVSTEMGDCDRERGSSHSGAF